jgi:hypothetical protein
MKEKIQSGHLNMSSRNKYFLCLIKNCSGTALCLNNFKLLQLLINILYYQNINQFLKIVFSIVIGTRLCNYN